jgi:hypothetical protein
VSQARPTVLVGDHRGTVTCLSLEGLKGGHKA